MGVYRQDDEFEVWYMCPESLFRSILRSQMLSIVQFLSWSQIVKMVSACLWQLEFSSTEVKAVCIVVCMLQWVYFSTCIVLCILQLVYCVYCSLCIVACVLQCAYWCMCVVMYSIVVNVSQCICHVVLLIVFCLVSCMVCIAVCCLFCLE